MMEKKLPAYLEVEPDRFKAILDCNYADVFNAHEIERNRGRGRRRLRNELAELLRRHVGIWKAIPSLPLRDICL